MAVLIDPPRWPAHGTRFAHLVSDDSLLELLWFADANGVPVRAFDHDHYDVPESRYPDLVVGGARPVSETQLVRSLVAGGLRVRTPDRTPKPVKVLPGLAAAWAALLPEAPALGAGLLKRWQEAHRSYHDVRHLAQLLAALTELCGAAAPREVALAAWFHDAVHDGVAATDERRSAELALAELTAAGVSAGEAEEVARLVLLTIDHAPEPGDVAGNLLVDADLSILGQPPGRYHFYSRGVRLEYPGFSDKVFAAGRLRSVHGLLSRERLFGSKTGRGLWEVQARGNLGVEKLRWSRLVGTDRAN